MRPHTKLKGGALVHDTCKSQCKLDITTSDVYSLFKMAIDGRQVDIVAVDLKCQYPVIGIIRNLNSNYDQLECWRLDGSHPSNIAELRLARGKPHAKRSARIMYKAGQTRKSPSLRYRGGEGKRSKLEV